jgi:glutamine---fructose-6-phosphate transaminase (isomerizing)
MCGIVAYLGTDTCINYIINGLKQLQNRGYDSVGLSFVENEKLNTIKYASTNTCNSLEKLELKMNETLTTSNCGIGHTRWATHGGKTDTNAHPHHDNKNRVAVVHNGIIENYHILKQKLQDKGYTFSSQTDTEVISVLIGFYLDQDCSIECAIQNTVAQLSGTWALIIVHVGYPNKLWAVRNGSPLLLGLEDDYVMVASEQVALCDTIKKYVILENNDLIEIKIEHGVIKYNMNIKQYPVKEKITRNEVTNKKYDHMMLCEIMEQPDAINRALNNGGRIDSNVSVKLGGLDSRKFDLLKIDHLIILGCGTSYNAGLWSVDIFKSLDIFDTVICYDGAEFNIKDIPKRGKTAVILLSQSGETKDIHRCIKIANDYDLITIGVVNVVDSQIARETNCGVYLNAGREVAVASTKSFTNQCIVLSMIAIWYSQNRGTSIEKRRKLVSDLRNLSFQMKNLLDNDNINNISSRIAELLCKSSNKSIFLLGKGRDEAIAKESALKLKEISYSHAEGYSTSALKHGTFALIEDGFPIFILDISDEHREKNRNAFQEVLARNAHVIRFTDVVTDEAVSSHSSLDSFGKDYSEPREHRECKDFNNKRLYRHSEDTVLIEKNSTYGGLLVNTYIQLISYKMALINGANPDYPRNLAKVVTVE